MPRQREDLGTGKVRKWAQAGEGRVGPMGEFCRGQVWFHPGRATGGRPGPVAEVGVAGSGHGQRRSFK